MRFAAAEERQSGDADDDGCFERQQLEHNNARVNSETLILKEFEPILKLR